VGGIFVTGDCTIDWQWIEIQAVDASRHLEQWWGSRRAVVCRQPGGAALLGAVLREAADSTNPAYDVAAPGIDTSAQPGDDRHHHSHMSCRGYRSSNNQGERIVWRVESSLGLTLASAPAPPHQDADSSNSCSVVVINDASLGFRDMPEMWPTAIREPAENSWFVLKMAHPVADGELWECLHGACPDRLVVVVEVDALRAGDVHISRGTSWERTALDLYGELVDKPDEENLTQCAHVVVTFPPVGALLLSRVRRGANQSLAESLRARLFFDPAYTEDTWAEQNLGTVVGYTTCMAAAIAHYLVTNKDRNEGTSEDNDLTPAVQAGLRAMREFYNHGYTPEYFPRQSGQPQSKGSSGRQTATQHPPSPEQLRQLTIPLKHIARALKATRSPRDDFPRVEVPFPFGPPPDGSTRHPRWTILQVQCKGDLTPTAKDIVTRGPEKALSNVPLGRFGRLVTADRREIEGYRSIRRLIAEYASQPTREAPLSIAVFGPPGAGKSFGVREVANSIFPDRIELVTANLSMMRDGKEFYATLHRVRDHVLKSRLPVVFWDEFDCNFGGEKLGWLKYFLAPMQDGVFQQGTDLHRIGRAIFVFAGGRFHTMDKLLEEAADSQRTAALKVQDFVSRLKGYVDVLGPDPNPTAKEDEYFIVRRAMILRNIFEQHAPQLKGNDGSFDIAPGVLNAFLCVSRYKHGARSIEALVTMSLLAGRSHFERSCLPTEEQLNLHVEGREFMALTRGLTRDVIDNIVRAHVGQQSSQPLLFPDLHGEPDRRTRDSSRIAVNDLIRNLPRAGYVLRRLPSSQSGYAPTDLEVESLARAGLRRDGSAGEALDEARWRELSEDERKRREGEAKAIFSILAKAGFFPACRV